MATPRNLERRLRRSLASCGPSFRSPIPTEVIVADDRLRALLPDMTITENDRPYVADGSIVSYKSYSITAIKLQSIWCTIYMTEDVPPNTSTAITPPVTPTTKGKVMFTLRIQENFGSVNKDDWLEFFNCILTRANRSEFVKFHPFVTYQLERIAEFFDWCCTCVCDFYLKYDEVEPVGVSVTMENPTFKRVYSW